jgi:hypothetical protein
VEVKIGIQSVPRELVLEIGATQEEVERMLKAAVDKGGVFALEDVKGGKVLVVAEKIAYVEFSGNEPRHVGFSNL